MVASLVSPILVGRHMESAALDAALARVLKADAVTVLVGGEAGVGLAVMVACAAVVRRPLVVAVPSVA
jgi:predicted ATPase